jgi:tetratricopeptide (TPR) repeat protein
MSARSELSTLEASGLIEIAALEPDLEYLFRHALVQEAAYATLLKKDRQALHRAAAEAILALHPGRERELAGVVAMHLEQAGDAALAAKYFVTAGEHALERFANTEAIAFFERAVKLGDPSDVDLRLRAAIGAAKADWYNGPGSGLEVLERTVAESDRADPRLVAEACFWTAFLRRQRGETPESSPALKAALDRVAQIGEALKDPATAALPRALMGGFDAFAGNLRRGAAEMAEALKLIEGQGDRISTAMISDFLVMTYARLGEFDAAEQTLARARDLALSSDEISRLDTDIARAAIDVERGDLTGASEQSLACARRAEDLGAYACVVAATVVYGTASLSLKSPGAATPSLERGRDLANLVNMGPMQTLIHGFLGRARADLGDLPGGVAEWDVALARAAATNDRYGEAKTLWSRARAVASQPAPDWSASLRDIDRALDLFEDMEAKPSVARVLHDRADALRALGRTQDAEAAEHRSGQLAAELGLRDLAPAGS